MGEKFSQWITAFATLCVAVTFFAAAWHFVQDLSYIQSTKEYAWVNRLIGMGIILIAAYMPYYFASKIIERMRFLYFGYGVVVTLVVCDIIFRFMILINNHMRERGLVIFMMLSVLTLLVILSMYSADHCLRRIKKSTKKPSFIRCRPSLLVDLWSDRH